MTNPFEHDGDDDAANDRAHAELKAAVGDQEEVPSFQPDPSPGEDLEVDLKPEGSPDFDLEPEPNRQEKKQNRYKHLQEEVERERGLRTRAEADAAAYRAMVSTQQGHRGAEPKSDPLQEEIDAVYKRRRNLAQQHSERAQAGTLTAAEEEVMLKEGRELEESTAALVYRREAAKERDNVDPRQKTIERIQIQYPDVAENAGAWAWADGRARQLLAKGRQYSQDLVREVMEETRREFRIGGAASPRDDRTRASLAAPTRGSGSRAAAPASGKIRMTPMMRSMADAAYPNIKDVKKRYQHWAETSGSAYLDMERKQGR